MKHNSFIYLFAYFPCFRGLNMVVQLYLFFVFLCENMTNFEESDKLKEQKVYQNWLIGCHRASVVGMSLSQVSSPTNMLHFQWTVVPQKTTRVFHQVFYQICNYIIAWNMTGNIIEILWLMPANPAYKICTDVANDGQRIICSNYQCQCFCTLTY